MPRIVAIVVLLAAVVLGVDAQNGPPLLPVDFSSKEFRILTDVRTNQSTYYYGVEYFDYLNNRTRFDDDVEGSTVWFYSPLFVEMLVDGNNHCKQYCSIDYSPIAPLEVPSYANDMGPTIVNNKTVEDWYWMFSGWGYRQTDDFYIDQSQSPAIPVQWVDDVWYPTINFQTTINYLSFTPGTPDPSKFDIKGFSNCPRKNNCDASSRKMLRLPWAAGRRNS